MSYFLAWNNWNQILNGTYIFDVTIQAEAVLQKRKFNLE
jgi:hypothetical protein